jgi:hypothetical protein
MVVDPLSFSGLSVWGFGWMIRKSIFFFIPDSFNAEIIWCGMWMKLGLCARGFAAEPRSRARDPILSCGVATGMVETMFIRLRNPGLNAKVALLGVGSALIAAVALVALAVWQSGQYNRLAQSEVDSLIAADLPTPLPMS